MSRIEPAERSELPHLEPMFQVIESAMGFLPSSFPTMAKAPGLAEAFGGLAAAVTTMGAIDAGLRQMVAHVASNAAGCRYCQAHTAAHAAHEGVDDEKIERVWEFETSDLFTDGERAALRIARDAAQSPSAVTDADFDALTQHFDEQQIIQIVATISMFGFLNRWNDTMATALEAEPLAYASTHLRAAGWDVGKHA